MKKGILKSLALLVALMVVSSGAWAFDNAYHVKQAPNGKGDLLFFPMYFTANGGWETKITVVNTSEQYSVIAKVIFKSHRYSAELLDFLIYLTPTDVWTGTIRYNGSNPAFPNASIYSEDDSVLVSDSVFATKAAPMNKNFFTGIHEPNGTTCPTITNDSGDRGYVEVIETWYGDVSQTYPAPIPSSLSRVRPVSKMYLKQLYPPTTNPGLGMPGGDKEHPGREAAALFPARGDGHQTDHTINVLAGYMEIQNLLQPGMTTAMRATVMADFDISSYLNGIDNTGLDIVGTQLALGGKNTIGELEAALSKDNIAMPYVNNPASGAFTVHVFNFPTKMSAARFDKNPTPCVYRNNSPYSPYWYDPAPVGGLLTGVLHEPPYACQRYLDPVYDLSEARNLATDVFSGGSLEKKMCEEVEVITSLGYSNLFTEGWTNYIFNYSDRPQPTTFPVMRSYPAPVFSYTGLPTIPFVLMMKNGGISLMEGAYNDGLVYSGLVPVFPAYPIGGNTIAYPNQQLAATVNWLPNYQYWNYIDQLGIHTNGVLNGAGVFIGGYPRATINMTVGPRYWDDVTITATVPQYFPY